MAIQTVKTGAAVNDGTGDDARTCFTKINSNFTNTSHAASRQVGEAAGNVMEVGAFGLGPGTKEQISDIEGTEVASGFFDMNYIPGVTNYASGIRILGNGKNWRHDILIPTDENLPPYIRSKINERPVTPFHAFCVIGRNVSKDPNGFIKAASPIISLYADKIEINDEAKLQPITFEKLGVGDYVIKGSTGFAQEGWYIEMPKDANGNVLVAVVYEQLDNNDISVKTYAKKFDEETGDIVANTAKPRDIPATRWIDLRVQELPQDDTQPLSKDETVAADAE